MRDSMTVKPFAVCLASFLPLAAQADVTLGDGSVTCAEDPACINRLHSGIPMVAAADPGERITFIGRDAADIDLDRDGPGVLSSHPREGFGVVHPLTGPVSINGARAGDVIAVTIESVVADDVGYTNTSSFGYAGDAVRAEDRFVVWRLNEEYAESRALPGVRIPNASFPGVVVTMPGEGQLDAVLEREQALADAGGSVYLPDRAQAEPASLCGEEGSRGEECLRTIPPREFGGNMDIRYIREGVTVYLPCHIDGCGLAIGDFHYAQGDGEVAGTAIEMDGDITVTVEIVDNPPDLSQGPHFEGPATTLGIPSERYYAVTGYPVKKAGEIPREIAYLADSKVAELTNLSNDINLAARNALVAMIDFIVDRYDYDRTQAYVIASVAVDLRIGQLVDTPNVGVVAVLPLDIFVSDD